MIKLNLFLLICLHSFASHLFIKVTNYFERISILFSLIILLSFPLHFANYYFHYFEINLFKSHQYSFNH